jgi:hypothetical protein
MALSAQTLYLLLMRNFIEILCLMYLNCSLRTFSPGNANIPREAILH